MCLVDFFYHMGRLIYLNSLFSETFIFYGHETQCKGYIKATLIIFAIYRYCLTCHGCSTV